ncbi:MAG: cupin domain-containing protein [Chloroflexi bacterium]|nr:cupin domain-containing protein [Chloroflexota bacterium]
MIKAGFTFEHPLTKTRLTVLESDAETNGMGWLLEVTRKARAKPDIAEHLHMTWTETFEIVSGTAKYSLDGIEKTAKAGESFVVEPRHLHIHPWNETDEVLVYRQKNRFEKASPAAVQDVLGIFATGAGLVRDRKIPKKGYQKLLQQAITVRTLIRHGGYTAKPSIFIQNLLGYTLGTLAAMLGYKAVYPKYVES